MLLIYFSNSGKAITSIQSWYTCYDFPSPRQSKALYCDVIDPATKEKRIIVLISPGGVNITN